MYCSQRQTVNWTQAMNQMTHSVYIVTFATTLLLMDRFSSIAKSVYFLDLMCAGHAIHHMCTTSTRNISNVELIQSIAHTEILIKVSQALQLIQPLCILCFQPHYVNIPTETKSLKSEMFFFTFNCSHKGRLPIF